MTIDLNKPLVYVTRDIERALGMEPKDNYFVISNKTPFGEIIKQKYPHNVWLIDTGTMLDTYDLLAHNQVTELITKLNADIIVFQNTSRIERIASEKKWRVLNPSAILAKKVEEKISQISWLGEDASLLPHHTVCAIKDVTFSGKKFVLQFNHSHTGQGTFVITSSADLEPLKLQFPERECRIVDFINGPVFTVNALVGDEILVGNPSYQITGLKPFTDLPYSTIGNDWELPLAPHYKNVYENINKIAARLGERLQDDGWRGLFGIDVVYDEKKEIVYLLEINARQAASVVYESELQKSRKMKGLTIFEAHLRALLGMSLHNYEIIPIETGSQIVKRVTEQTHTIDTEELVRKGLTLTAYVNTIHNKELYRIQSKTGIMEGHKLFNSLGLFILSCVRRN